MENLVDYKETFKKNLNGGDYARMAFEIGKSISTIGNYIDGNIPNNEDSKNLSIQIMNLGKKIIIERAESQINEIREIESRLI